MTNLGRYLRIAVLSIGGGRGERGKGSLTSAGQVEPFSSTWERKNKIIVAVIRVQTWCMKWREHVMVKINEYCCLFVYFNLICQRFMSIQGEMAEEEEKKEKVLGRHQCQQHKIRGIFTISHPCWVRDNIAVSLANTHANMNTVCEPEPSRSLRVHGIKTQSTNQSTKKKAKKSNRFRRDWGWWSTNVCGYIHT